MQRPDPGPAQQVFVNSYSQISHLVSVTRILGSTAASNLRLRRRCREMAGADWSGNTQGDNRLVIREVIVLGSTGSIGTQALDVIGDNADRFRVTGLAAGGTDVELLARQVIRTRATAVAIADQGRVPDFEAALAAAESTDRVILPTRMEPAAHANPTTRAKRQRHLEILAGPDASAQLAARGADVVLNGITGAAGLEATLSALGSGATLALANKESLVVGGRLVTAAATPGQIVPVDSEHSALAQCLRAGRREEIARLVLTASGGPFRGWSREAIADVTPKQALAHPTWKMGPVVTINSATLVNKGLELIEAHLLFDTPLTCIDVVVHPQSVVHSMVTFTDGSTIAQASPPDMRLPIAMALGWPDRVASKARACDWSAPTAWAFEPVDEAAFPAIELARLAGAAAGTAPAVFNAANEICVEAFLRGRIRLPEIVETVAAVLTSHLKGDPVARATRLGTSLLGERRTRESHDFSRAEEAEDTSPTRAAAARPDNAARSDNRIGNKEIETAEFGVTYVPDAELTLAAVFAADEWARAQARSRTAGLLHG